MKGFSNSTPSVASTSNRRKANHHWLNHPHTLNDATSLAEGLRGSSHIAAVIKGNLGLTFLRHFTRVTLETKRSNLSFPQRPHLVWLHQEQKEELMY